MSVRGITGVQQPRPQRAEPGGRMLRHMTTRTGWLGHKEIPQPALVRRERLGPRVDWLDCMLALWIAEAMLEAEGEDR